MIDEKNALINYEFKIENSRKIWTTYFSSIWIDLNKVLGSLFAWNNTFAPIRSGFYTGNQSNNTYISKKKIENIQLLLNLESIKYKREIRIEIKITTQTDLHTLARILSEVGNSNIELLNSKTIDHNHHLDFSRQSFSHSKESFFPSTNHIESIVFIVSFFFLITNSYDEDWKMIFDK